MQIRDWGEEGFITYLTTQFPRKNAVIGIGDDCAVIPEKNEISWLVTTDALVEGIHFIKEQISPKDLGYKTVAVNVSDIAAKGGTPQYAFLTMALPSTVERVWLEEFVQGIKEACRRWNLQLLGGDTVGSKRDLFLSLTLTGFAPSSQIKYRHLARPGDVICVNAPLGDSGGGLKALQKRLPKTKEIQSLIHHHFHPEPNPEEGIWLSAQGKVSAMMDLSDGLDIDVRRLLTSSQCGAVIEISILPVSDALVHACLENNWDAFQLALVGGEDYCLLFTISQGACDSIAHLFQEKFGHPFYQIGWVTDPSTGLIYHKQGKPIELQLDRYSHFQ